MKITVITVVFNNVSTLPDTIKSVASQQDVDLEYIIIDGGSTDGSLEVIKAYETIVSKWVSEPDAGIYDAMNKGISLATGDVIGFLNADDVYASTDVLKAIANQFGDAEVLYGDLQYRKPDLKKVVRIWKSGNYKHGDFLLGWMPPHPTFYARKSCFERWGGFRLELRSAADYELMLRFLHKHHAKVVYLPKMMVHMRTGGVSNSSLNNRINANQEDKKAWEMNGLNPWFFTLWLKPIRKLPQFVFFG
jgi:glycosyltransferase involved in cell wall biosynthesis